MIKIIILITALVLFWVIFGKMIMKFVNFSLKIAFRVFFIIISILVVLHGSLSYDSDNSPDVKNDIKEIEIEQTINDVVQLGDSLVETETWKNGEKKVYDFSKSMKNKTKDGLKEIKDVYDDISNNVKNK